MRKSRKPATRQKPKRRLKTGFKIGLILTCALLVAAAAVCAVTVWFPIRAVTVRGQSVYSEAQIIEASGIRIGDNLFHPLLSGSKAQIYRALPYIKTVRYSVRLPGTFRLRVEPYTAAFQFLSGGQYVLTAEDGVILEFSDTKSPDLPVIAVNELKGKIREKRVLGGETAEADCDALTALLPDFPEPVSRIDLRRSADIRLYFGQTEARLGGGTYLPQKLKMVRKVAADLPAGQGGVIDVSAWTPENKKANYTAGE